MPFKCLSVSAHLSKAQRATALPGVGKRKQMRAQPTWAVQTKTPVRIYRNGGLNLEAQAGIEPTYTDLQSAA